MTAPLAIIQRALQTLNRALKADPDAMRKLLRRKQCVRALAEDPDILVEEDEGVHWLSMLGLLNGILGLGPQDCIMVQRTADETF